MKRGEVLETAFFTYTVQSLIGAGRSSEVYEVLDQNKNVFAVKILRIDSISKERYKRFQNEIFFCEKGNHKNIIRILDKGFKHSEKNDKVPFFIMKRFDSTLKEMINSGIDNTKIFFYFFQILDGIEFAHKKGSFHRDLKPENILFSKRNDLLVVSDFGIAHFKEEELLTAVETSNSERLANFLYAAPEQKIRGKQVGLSSDIFALGLIFNEMFTGDVPLALGFKKIGDVLNEYSFCDDIVDKCIQNDPSKRYKSVEELKDEILKQSRVRKIQDSIRDLQNKRDKEIVLNKIDDDLLVKDPVKIVDFDFDADDSYLKVILNHVISDKWEMIFKGIPGSHSSHHNRTNVKFVRDKLILYTPPNFAHEGMRYIKEWIDSANKEYKKILIEESEREKDEQNREQERKMKSERIRLEVLKKIGK